MGAAISSPWMCGNFNVEVQDERRDEGKGVKQKRKQSKKTDYDGGDGGTEEWTTCRRAHGWGGMSSRMQFRSLIVVLVSLLRVLQRRHR